MAHFLGAGIIFSEGFFAYCEGMDSWSNPYPKGSLPAEIWRSGWISACRRAR
jgi:hypothetical protein